MQRGTVVVKIGSNSLIGGSGRIDRAFLRRMAVQLAAVLDAGWRPIVVSSGAVACGLGILGLGTAPDSLPERQALAAVGQADLVHAWQVSLGKVGLQAAQVLLNQDDLSARERYLNLTATLRTLHDHRVVPVVNENDTVAVEELTVGDNDRLSALVASSLEAAWLVLLTDVDGLYDGDPREDDGATVIPELTRVTKADIERVGGAGRLGRGGMRSKLEAARIARRAGVTTVIANARAADVLPRILAGEAIGTHVRPEEGRHSSRQRWLGFARHVSGTVVVDAGAERALQTSGRSLLPVGIVAVEGDFVRGDTVEIVGPDGEPIARGLASLSAAELARVIGKRMDAAARILGYALPKAAVHRDNLVLTRH